MKVTKKRFWWASGVVGLSLAVWAAVAMATGITKDPNDTLQLGRSSSSDDVEVVAEVGDGSANPRLRVTKTEKVWQFSNNGVDYSDIGAGAGGSGGINILLNPDIETGNLTGWNNTGGGTLAVTSTAVDVAFGGFALDYDAAAAADDVRSDQISIPTGLLDQNCLGRIYYKGGDANLTLQVIDGSSNVLGEQLLAASTGYRTESVSFICPGSGTIALRVLASADAAAIKLDNLHLGENFLVGQVSQAREYGTLIYPGAANCSWSSTSGTFANYAVDADCTGDSATGQLDTPATDVPGFTLNNLEPGKYQIIAQGGFETSDESSVCRWRLNTSVTDSNGKANSGITQVGTSTDTANTLVGYFTYDTAESLVDIQIQVKRDSGAGNCLINNDTATDKELNFIVNRLPIDAQIALRPEQVQWHVDVNQGGGNPSLGTASVATYTGLTNAGLSTTVNPGSIATLQACETTEAASGSTCTGDESVGITFDVSAAGKVQACATFSWNSDVTAGSAAATFQIVQTGNADQIIGAEGMGRAQSTHEDEGTTVDGTFGQRVCGNFIFNSTGTKTLRLFYEQVAAGTVNTSIILADEAAANGQRDIHWEVYPLRSFIQAPQILNHVETNASSGIKIASVDVDCDGQLIISQTGNWVSSIVENAAGECDVNFVAGVFNSSNLFHCQATLVTGTPNSRLAIDKGAGCDTTSCRVETRDSTGALASRDFTLLCIGEK